MSIFRILFFVIAFYIIFRAVKYFIRYFNMSADKYNRMKQKQGKYSKEDIEEARYTEIETEYHSGRDSKEQQK